MKYRLLRTILLAFIFMMQIQIKAQSFYSTIFVMDSKSKIVNHYDIRDKPTFGFEEGSYLLFGYRHQINTKYNLHLYFQYSQYSPLGGYSTKRNPYTYLTNFTYAITSSKNIDIGIQKKINLAQNRIYLNMATGLRMVSIKQEWPYDSDIEVLGTVHYYAFPGYYYLPQLEIGLDFKFWKRWHFTIMKMYTFGLYGRFQEVWFDYNFKGELPRTITYINGTTKQFHLGIQFDIVKSDGTNSKKRKKKKRWKLRK